MDSHLHASPAQISHKHNSSSGLVLGWMMAKARDVMTAAEVLHDIQWAAPWDEPARGKARKP